MGYGSWSNDVSDSGEATREDDEEEKVADGTGSLSESELEGVENESQSEEDRVSEEDESESVTDLVEEEESEEESLLTDDQTVRSNGQSDDEGSDDEQPTIESVDTISESSETTEDETEETEENSGQSDQSSGGSEVAVPSPSGATSISNVADRERRWKILVWGQPGLFKTHFSCTMPEPIAFLDLEGKSQDIASKFQDRAIEIWEPTNFRDAQDALHSAIDWLEAYREATGEVGTIVIDSMGLAWEWAKTTYKTESYPMTDNDEVVLSSNIGNSQDSDWQHIKGMHNSEFREVMTDSDFHFLWTSGEKEDYSRVISGDTDTDLTPMTDDGEKNNQHKADSVIRARHDSEKGKVGDLTKSNFTDHKFVGMKRPTFQKFVEAIEDIEEAESSTQDVSTAEIKRDHGIEIISGKPALHGGKE